MFIYLILNYRGYKEVPKPSHLPDSPPPLSVIIACKKNASSIGNCLDSLGRQDYPNMEIIVLNENPTNDPNDETTQIVKNRAKEYSNIFLHQFPASPKGWSGKTYLQHQGALMARGDWLLFLDPRTVLQPNCISRSISYCLDHQIDFFSLMPGYHLRTFWEKLILPIVFGWFGTRFSLQKVNDPKSKQAVAVGQYMQIRKKAYQATGGFQNVKNEILEDSALARTVKGMGLKYRLLGGKHLLTSRVYGGLREIWQMWERVFVGEVGSSPLAILYTFTIIGITTILPFVSVLWCAFVLGLDAVNPWILLLIVGQCVLVLTARLLLDMVLGIGPLFAFLQPIGASFALAILVSSLYHTILGSLEKVKGRVASEI